MTTPTSYPYRRPGVYVTESLTPLPQQISPPGLAVAAFVGTHSSGPSSPIKVNSWEQFMGLYGGFGNGLNYLPFAVYEYFANGGRQAWILRATPTDSVASQLTVKNRPLPPAETIVATPDGSAPTGSGTKPGSKVTSVSFVSPGPGSTNPQQTAFSIEWSAVTPLSGVDAYQVVLTQPAEGAFSKTIWVQQPTSGKPSASFTGLAPGTAYSVQITPYKGATAGDPMDSGATFTTADPYTSVDALSIRARGRGAYGNQLSITTTPSWTTGRFHLFVKHDGVLVESWQDVSLHPGDPRYVVGLLNSGTNGSAYVVVESLLPPSTATPGTGQTPDDSWAPEYLADASLDGGLDGVTAVNLAEQLSSQFGSIDDVLLLNLCGNTTMADHVPATTQVNTAIAWLESRGGGFLVLDVPRQPAPITADAATTEYVETLGAFAPASSFAACYGPWIQVADPAGASVSSTRMLPPAGAVMGQFSQADAAIGPNRSPAGVAYSLVGTVGVEHLFSGDQLDALNDVGCNVIRPVPQSGYCIMGARTLKKGMPDRYISIRRMLTYLESLLEDVTRFAVFEPNGPGLWQTLDALVTQQLMTLTQAGQLQSSVPDQAFFVTCDETNNTPQTVANGEIHIRVGVALASPAEFVIIEISQYQGGVSQVSTSVESAA
ncbi:fibronectin type III domain-containing protein [Streptomyces malaysiensis]|uniref:Phage tail sheath protein FI n=1 Tax=Streptomyces malaysiensis TaxID=92644 RepID=A0A7X6AZI6_STRMQ|nr:fibronectin type III domain-containing protein [Streptomyces malaysiensis]NIY68048.1 phage tail sheath protein FI [Streptomyces malaysiensis]